MVSRQLLLADGSELVVLCTLFAFGEFPFRPDPFLPFKPMQGRIERAGLDCEYIRGPVADYSSNRMTVHRLALQRLQNEHVQRSLQQFNAILIFWILGHVDVDILLPRTEAVYPYPHEGKAPYRFNADSVCDSSGRRKSRILYSFRKSVMSAPLKGADGIRGSAQRIGSASLSGANRKSRPDFCASANRAPE